LIQVETISVLHQKTQTVWSNKTIFALRVLPNRLKEITRCHAGQVNVVAGTEQRKEQTQKIKRAPKNVWLS
jgi:hypothetical protein